MNIKQVLAKLVEDEPDFLQSMQDYADQWEAATVQELFDKAQEEPIKLLEMLHCANVSTTHGDDMRWAAYRIFRTVPGPHVAPMMVAEGLNSYDYQNLANLLKWRAGTLSAEEAALARGWSFKGATTYHLVYSLTVPIYGYHALLQQVRYVGEESSERVFKILREEIKLW